MRALHISKGGSMSKALRSRLVVTIVVSSAVSLWGQTAPPADLDSYVANSMKTFEVPGIAVAVVKDGKVVLAKGYGVRKLDDPTPVGEYTMFGIGSNTK